MTDLPPSVEGFLHLLKNFPVDEHAACPDAGCSPDCPARIYPQIEDPYEEKP